MRVSFDAIGERGRSVGKVNFTSTNQTKADEGDTQSQSGLTFRGEC